MINLINNNFLNNKHRQPSFGVKAVVPDELLNPLKTTLANSMDVVSLRHNDGMLGVIVTGNDVAKIKNRLELTKELLNKEIIKRSLSKKLIPTPKEVHSLAEHLIAGEIISQQPPSSLAGLTLCIKSENPNHSASIKKQIIRSAHEKIIEYDNTLKEFLKKSVHPLCYKTFREKIAVLQSFIGTR